MIKMRMINRMNRSRFIVEQKENIKMIKQSLKREKIEKNEKHSMNEMNDSVVMLLQGKILKHFCCLKKS